MIDGPVIRITKPEVIEKENETIYDYDNSHLIYKMQDLGSFAELQKMKAVNQQLKENNLAMQEEMARTWAKLQQKEDIINKAYSKIEKMFDIGDENKVIDDLLETQKILDNKGSDNNE